MGCRGFSHSVGFPRYILCTVIAHCFVHVVLALTSNIRLWPNELGDLFLTHAEQGPDTRQVGRMPKVDQTHQTSHAGVKGEFVGKQVSPDGKFGRTGCSKARW